MGVLKAVRRLLVILAVACALRPTSVFAQGVSKCLDPGDCDRDGISDLFDICPTIDGNPRVRPPPESPVLTRSFLDLTEESAPWDSRFGFQDIACYRAF